MLDSYLLSCTDRCLLLTSVSAVLYKQVSVVDRCVYCPVYTGVCC